VVVGRLGLVLQYSGEFFGDKLDSRSLTEFTAQTLAAVERSSDGPIVSLIR
jgi:hypothetical protein